MIQTSTLIIFIVVVIILVYFCYTTEHKSQDCSNVNQPCINYTPLVQQSDSLLVAIEKLIETSRKNFNSVGWRRAMFVSLLVSLIICLLIWIQFLEVKMTASKLIIMIVIIFGLVYLSTVYVQNCWWAPRSLQLEDQILNLRSINQTRNNSNRTKKYHTNKYHTNK